MTTEDLIKHAAKQPLLTIQRSDSVPGPQLKALIAEGKPILLTELLTHPDQHRELRTFRYAHVLGAGVSGDQIGAWQAAHPGHPLPPDLCEFLKRVDGVHLWADLASSRAYFGILPLKEWQDAKAMDWAVMFKSPPVGQLVISYHDNGDNYLLLDTRVPEYLWYDLEDFDHPKRIGRTVAELLDFWWQETAWLDPRQTGEAR
jgi:SMI1 / KNR4 family (SUKH-1)